jgi:hypothetical protein
VITFVLAAGANCFLLTTRLFARTSSDLASEVTHLLDGRTVLQAPALETSAVGAFDSAYPLPCWAVRWLAFTKVFSFWHYHMGQRYRVQYMI